MSGSAAEVCMIAIDKGGCPGEARHFRLQGRIGRCYFLVIDMHDFLRIESTGTDLLEQAPLPKPQANNAFSSPPTRSFSEPFLAGEFL